MGNVKKSVAKRTRHKRQYDGRMKERQMQSRESKVVSSKALDASLVVTECSGTKSYDHITSSFSGTYITHVVDADIRPVNDQEPSVKVHFTAQHNVLANEQQHTDQFEPSYDTYLLEKVDRNTTPDSSNMCHKGREIDQDAEQDQVKSSLLKAEVLKMNDMVEKEVYNEPSNRFLQLQKHCISLEISMQQKEESFQSNTPCGNQRVVFSRLLVLGGPFGKMFTDCTTKVDSEPLNGLNDDITNLYKCDQTLNVSAGLDAQLLTPRTISLGLVPQPPSPTLNVPPTKNDWDTLFLPMFDEYFNPSPSVAQPVLIPAVQEPVVSSSTPSSTRIDQDTPSTSTSQTIKEVQSHVIPTSVEKDDHGIEVAHMDNDL
nr:hypothetical protein [Tanacetum cinerariifolium]